MPPHPITELLHAVRQGQASAGDRLLSLVYGELEAMAHGRLAPRDRRPVTLDTHGLVHEVYIKLFGGDQVEWQSRKHFFSVAALAMRQIIVDHARKSAAAKRGGAVRPLPLDSSIIAVDEQAEHLVALDDALARLARLDERLAKVVELRFFVGLTNEEIARVLETSERTVKRDWRKARALLFEAMSGGAT